jgi:hypothetical protein
MKITEIESEAAYPDKTVATIGELLRLRALVFEGEDHGGLGEYNYDGTVLLLQDEIEAAAIFEDVAAKLPTFEEENEELESESFVGLYKTPWGFAVLAGDSCGDIASYELSQRDDRAVHMAHFTRDRMIYELKLET